MESIEGGRCDAGAIMGIGLGVAGVISIFVAPPTAFWIVPAGTAAGIGLGQALADCIDISVTHQPKPTCGVECQ